MLTLNQIKNKLIEWFQNHAQVNEVVYGDEFDFGSERNITYPVVNVFCALASITDKSMNYSFLIKIGDIAGDDTDRQVEVQSDSLLIAEDFCSFLQYEEGWVFNNRTSFNLFSDDGGDRVSGVTFTVQLSVVRSQNTCATPTKQP